MRAKILYEKETNWGYHWVSKGFGKYEGKFIAQSRGAGGAKGYFRVFDTEEEAKAHVEHSTRPLPKDDIVPF